LQITIVVNIKQQHFMSPNTIPHLSKPPKPKNKQVPKTAPASKQAKFKFALFAKNYLQTSPNLNPRHIEIQSGAEFQCSHFNQQ
jgi:hypothetical protein